MSDEKPWSEMTAQERAFKIAEGRRKSREARDAEVKAAPAAATPPPVEEPEEAETPPVEEPPAEEDFGGFSAEEMAKIRAEARKTVDAEIAKRRRADRAVAMKDAIEAEERRLRSEAGLSNVMDDIVDIVIDCPPHSSALILNFGMDEQKVYAHGGTYKVTRAVHDTLTEMMARGWDAEDRAGNPNRKFYQRTFASTQNPDHHTRMGMDGTRTLGHNPTINFKTGGVAGPTYREQ